MAAYKIIAVISVCISSIYGHSFYPSLSPAFSSFHQPVHIVKTYQPPLNLFNPSYDLKFGGPFYQPQLPPFFAEPKPSNETTEEPDIQTSSEGTDNSSEELTTSKPDFNDTVITSAVSFDDLFTKTIISPEFGFVPRKPVYIANRPVFPEYEQVVIPSQHDNFLVNHLNRLNDAYGLPGFRPFYYNESIRRLFASNSSTESTTPSSESTTKSSGKVPDILTAILRMKDPNIVVFNTKNAPYPQVSDEVKTDEDLDVRSGTSKSEKTPFSQVYKDVMYLNRSFLSTVAPYLH